ncbi:pheromone A receptor-domain-containing protein [Crassisporium funariophilum]|nr:pheromone A receptor-domain-containing protein [Crassisporium funariophilum]
MHPEFAPVAIISALSLLLPLPWHWRAGNVATLSIITWLFVSNIIYAADALVWGDNVDIVSPLWCDITTKLIIGANFALPAACLCICIHLERVASVRVARTNVSDKRRRQLFEAAMCFGLPLIFMGLHYIVQGHRFDIIEGYGCRPTTYFSIPAIFIVWIPPIIMSIASIVYAGLALRHFMIRRLSFAAHLNSSSSALTTSRYLRLMTMAALQMVWSIAVTSYALWFTVMAVPIRKWTTWGDVHSDWLRIDLFPAEFTPEFVARAFYVLWWLIPASTFLFVSFFAFGKDAMDEYKKCFVWFRVNILRQSPSSINSKGSFSVMPMSRTKPIRDLKISKPKSMSDSGATESTLPAYNSSDASYSPKKTRSSFNDFESDCHSEVTSHYPSPTYGESKAIGSYADLTLHTPSTISAFTPGTSFYEVPEAVPETPSSSITSSTPLPRLRTLILSSSPTSPRPVTYPSFDASHRLNTIPKPGSP